MKKNSEQVNHPEHYGGEDNPYEAIKVIEAWGLDNDFCLGNVVKYVSRAGKKVDKKAHKLRCEEEGKKYGKKAKKRYKRAVKRAKLQDLEKALWYLERKIKKFKEKF